MDIRISKNEMALALNEWLERRWVAAAGEKKPIVQRVTWNSSENVFEVVCTTVEGFTIDGE